jgi:UDP-glucose 4-epimerase
VVAAVPGGAGHDGTGGRALVLGATGLLGSHVVQDLLDGDWRVVAVSRRSVAVNRRLYPPGRLDCVAADLADTDRMLGLVAGTDVCLHLVHATVPGESMVDLTNDLVETVVPTVHLLSRIPAGSLRRLVYVSSGGTVYGRARVVPTPEDHPTEPISAYGVAKLTLEKYVRLCAGRSGFSSAVLRPSNVYGPGQNVARMQGVVGVFLDRLLRDEPIRVWGAGGVVRDYLHATDAARAVRLAAEAVASDVWNAGSGVAWRLDAVIRLLERVTGRTARVRYAPARPFDVPVSVLDAARIRSALGWAPAVSLEEGVRRLYERWSPEPGHPTLAWRRAAPAPAWRRGAPAAT